MMFKNRIDGGIRLARKLAKYKNKDGVVLALPRGGVITAKIISDELKMPLGLIIVRKIGAPFNSEYAIAAISESGNVVKNEFEVKNVDLKWFESEIERQKEEIERRKKIYWGDKKPIEMKDKTAIIVDDGIATGLTMLAAIEEAKKQGAKKIVVAVPVSPKDTAKKIEKEIDELVCVEIPEYFAGAVGDYYEDFRQVEDEEVIRILNK